MCRVSAPRPHDHFWVQTQCLFSVEFVLLGAAGSLLELRRCLLYAQKAASSTALHARGSSSLPAPALPSPKPRPHSAHRTVHHRGCGHAQSLPNRLGGQSGHPVPLGNRPWCFTIGSWEVVTFELMLAAPAQGGQTNWITLQISWIRLWSLSIWDLVCFSWKNACHVPAASPSQGAVMPLADTCTRWALAGKLSLKRVLYREQARLHWAYLLHMLIPYYYFYKFQQNSKLQ